MDDIVVVTGLNGKRVTTRAYKVNNGKPAPFSVLNHVTGPNAKVIRVACRKGKWVVEDVKYFEIGPLVTDLNSSQREIKDITSIIKKKSDDVREAAYKFLKKELDSHVSNQQEAQTGWSFSHSDMSGYVHWYSLLDGVSRPCVNGFRMMAFLDFGVAVQLLHNACSLARK